MTAYNKELSNENSGVTLFKGVVHQVTFHSDKSGFVVFKADPEPGSSDSENLPGTLATIVASIPEPPQRGTPFIARGIWGSHPRFGRQFRAFSFTETDPVNADAIERYLGSGIVKGLGPVLAERIVKLFGDDTLKIIDSEPQRLSEVPGIGKKKLDEILSAWGEKKNLREVMLFFQNYDIPQFLAQRIYSAYRERSIEIIKNDPFILSREVFGFGFHTADRIARALGFDSRSLSRVVAGVRHILEEASENGHVFLQKDILLSKSSALLEIDDIDLLQSGFERAVNEAIISIENNNAYLPQLLNAEIELAKTLSKRIYDIDDDFGISKELIYDVTSRTQTAISQGKPITINLSDEQKHAVTLAAEKRLLVITGGPGCGKTTVVRTITKLFQRACKSIRLCAPTGRAAQRLSEVCDLPASTIHRLLKYDPISKCFIFDENNKLPLDVLIVDESSMIDLQLATSLFRAIPKNAHIIIVGDANQLPSVGPGLFLADLLDISEIPRVSLSTLFRRAEESAITTIAHQVNRGAIPQIPEPNGNAKSDAYFLASNDPANAAQLVERLVIDQIPKKFNIPSSQIIVLSPMNQGDLGVIALNQKLQAKLITQKAGLPAVKVGNLELRLGDRVCQRVNNYNLHEQGVFNGDQGEIIGIDLEKRMITVKLWDERIITYPSDTINQLDLAYALTIHRSQGSEVSAVVLVIHDSHTIMLERQLLYTAITRAKKLLVIVGTKRALATAVKRTRSKRRNSSLPSRVRELII